MGRGWNGWRRVSYVLGVKQFKKFKAYFTFSLNIVSLFSKALTKYYYEVIGSKVASILYVIKT